MRLSSLRRPELWAGAIMIVILMGTALVSPLYPIYRETWDLNTSQVTQLYVIYMLGALLSLLIFGRLADQIGYKPVMGAALILALIGTAMSLGAPNYVFFCVARFIVGVAASLVTISGSLAVIGLTPSKYRAHIPLLISLFISGGFALGPVLGGVIGQWGPMPLVTVHLPSFVLLLGCIIVFWLLPTLPARGGFNAVSLIPRLSWTTPDQSIRLALACCLPFLGFGIFGLYASLAPMLIRNFTGLTGPFISGLYIGTFLVGAATFQIVGRRITAKSGAILALILMALGNAIMCFNLSAGSFVLFVAGVVIAAIGHGFCILSSTTITQAIASDHNRGGLNATYWAIGYAGSIFPMSALGWASDRWGVELAVFAFCLIVITLCLVVAGLMAVHKTKA